MNEFKQNWFQLTSIQIGGAICFPVIMIGQILFQTYGFYSSLIALILGNILLFLLALPTFLMSFKSKLSTAENAKNYFGKNGAKIFALIISSCLIGWFAIQLNLISLSINETLTALGSTKIPLVLLNLFFGLIITLFLSRGTDSLDKISSFTLPLLAATMAYSVYKAYNSGTAFSNMDLSATFNGLSLILAGSIIAVADLPTYYRFAKSKKHGIISICILFLVAIPLIQFVGIYIASKNPGKNIIDLLSYDGRLPWKLWVGLFLFFAGWTTNNTNLYSAAISFRSILENWSERLAIYIMGFLGTILACLNLLDHFEMALNLMGSTIVSMSAVVIVNFVLGGLLNKTLHYAFNIISVFIGSMMTLLSILDVFKFTEIALIDSYITATFATLCFYLLWCLNGWLGLKK